MHISGIASCAGIWRDSLRSQTRRVRLGARYFRNRLCEATISLVCHHDSDETGTIWTLTTLTAFHMPKSPASSAEAAYLRAINHRRSVQLPLGPYEPVHQQLPNLFGCHLPPSPEVDDDHASDGQSTPDEAEQRENFLGRVQSYSKLMHAHTKYQLSSPSTNTLPSYTQTMHSFTLNQLNHHNDVPKSERASPQRGVSDRHVHLPLKACTELSKLSLSEVPAAPFNTPEPGVLSEAAAIDFRKTKRRSVTEPIPRDFSTKSRDFALR